MPGEIHDEHPFQDAEELRDPMRRFRGRLSAPVTVITAGDKSARAGLTVSSVVVAGDAEPRVHFVLGPDSYLWDAIRRTERFVVHILDADQHGLADSFAGVRPSPGGPFTGLEVVPTPHGPVLTACPTRANCSYDSVFEGDGYLLVAGRIDLAELHDLTDPIQWFRGSYRRLTPQ